MDKVYKKLGVSIYIIFNLCIAYVLIAGNAIFDLFNVFLLFGTVVFIIYQITKNDIFSPLSIANIFFYISFVCPLFFLFSRDIDVALNSVVIAKSLLISLIGLIGFVCGSVIKRKKTNIFPKKWMDRPIRNDISYISHSVLLLWFSFSGYLRYYFKLGVAGEHPLISFAGIFQYLLYEGNIILFSYSLLFSLKSKDKRKIILSVISGLVLVITQAILGWRSAIFSIFIISFLLMGLSIKFSLNKKNNTKLIILLFVILIPILVKFGDTVRSEKNQVVGEFAKSNTVFDFVEKILVRQQGLTRLMVVVSNNTDDFFLNDFFIFELNNQNISPTQYIDMNYYGVKEGVAHSVGGSGPGCLFLSLGTIGVFFGYFILGLFISTVYASMKVFHNRECLMILYASLINYLPYAIAENFGIIETLKKIFVFLFFSIFWNYFFMKKKYRFQRQLY
jgi:hypothetical protein